MVDVVHLTQLQFDILVCLDEITQNRIKRNGREISAKVNAMRKANGDRTRPYPTIYENLKKLQKVRDLRTRKQVPFVKLVKPPKERGFWVLTQEGKDWLESLK